MKEEIFGPLLPIITYMNIEQAIEIIKKKEKPLVVYYYGENSVNNKNLAKVRDQTSSGAFVVNEYGL
jgi:acyl-CoA reductase-like NAD-dependent aldehyde dehydrogenase